MYSAFVSGYKQAPIDKYKQIEAMTKGNGNKCIVNQLKDCVKERKHWYD
jgi:hypothetical protein